MELWFLLKLNQINGGGKRWEKPYGTIIDHKLGSLFNCTRTCWLVTWQIHWWRTESSSYVCPSLLINSHKIKCLIILNRFRWESIDKFRVDVCIDWGSDGCFLYASWVCSSPKMDKSHFGNCCCFSYYLLGHYCSCFWVTQFVSIISKIQKDK